MRKYVPLVCLFLAANGFAQELHNFDQIKSAITTGKLIRIAVDFSQCSPANKENFLAKYPFAVFTPNEVVINNDGNIAASLMHFTLNDPNFPAKPVYQFIRYTITADNNVTLSAQVLDAVNYTPITNKFSFNCKIDTGSKIYV